MGCPHITLWSDPFVVDLYCLRPFIWEHNLSHFVDCCNVFCVKQIAWVFSSQI